MKGVLVVLMVMVMVLGSSISVDSQSMYACWGGCYNKCFLGNVERKFACHYSCLNTCIPRTKSDYLRFCKIGCSLKRCIPFSKDGAKMEECFGWCTNLCSSKILSLSLSPSPSP